jgi:hypothetical protein
MKKGHLVMFLIGTVFWGVLFASVHASWRLFASVPTSFWSTFGLYIAATFIVSTTIQWYLNGFPVGEPFFWFFYPLISWVVFLVVIAIESLWV